MGAYCPPSSSSRKKTDARARKKAGDCCNSAPARLLGKCPSALPEGLFPVDRIPIGIPTDPGRARRSRAGLLQVSTASQRGSGPSGNGRVLAVVRRCGFGVSGTASQPRRGSGSGMAIIPASGPPKPRTSHSSRARRRWECWNAQAGPLPCLPETGSSRCPPGPSSACRNAFSARHTRQSILNGSNLKFVPLLRYGRLSQELHHAVLCPRPGLFRASGCGPIGPGLARLLGADGR